MSSPCLVTIGRRTFLEGLGPCVLATPSVAEAQTAVKLHRVGYLTPR